MPPLETDESEEDTGGVPPLYTDNSEEDTGYRDNEDSDNLDVWIESISGHNWEIENFIQAAFVLSTNDSPDTMEQLDVHPPLSQEGCEDDQRDRRERQPEIRPVIKSISYLDDMLIYSEDLTERSLSYIDDTLPHSENPTENSSKDMSTLLERGLCT